ncbi:MAG TPA: hypothetical protein VF808_16475 [Ktedonobacterales bacterium]
MARDRLKYSTVWRWLRPLAAALPPLALLLLLTPAPALAHGPGYTKTLAVGPYVLDVSLSDYPPITDQTIEVIVTPRAGTPFLTGRLDILPGLGTDAVPLRATLAPVRGSSALVTNIHIPVRGAWIIAVSLNGARGAGTASFDIVVGAPGAIPIWMGWAIGLTPLYAFTWLVWRQSRYRRQLVAQRSGGAASASGGVSPSSA